MFVNQILDDLTVEVVKTQRIQIDRGASQYLCGNLATDAIGMRESAAIEHLQIEYIASLCDGATGESANLLIHGCFA